MTNFGGPNPLGGGQPAGPPAGPPPYWQQQAPAPGYPTHPPQQWGAPGYPAPPASPPRNRRRLILALAGAAIALILVVTGIVVVTSGGLGSATAGDTVKTYLEALARGDAETALAQGINEPPDKTFLTDDVLKKQIAQAPITDIKIVESTDTGKVHVLATFGDQMLDEVLYLKQDGEGGPWKLENAVLPVDFQKDSATGNTGLIDAITLFGTPIPKSGRPFVFPGPVDFGSSNPNVAITVVNPTYLLGELAYGVNVNYSFDVTDAGKQAINQAMLPVFAECAKSHELSPPKCPQRAGVPGLVEGTADWIAPTTLDDVDYFGSLDKQGKSTVMGKVRYTMTLRATNPVFNETNVVRSFSFTGYAYLATQPPTFELYTG